MDDALGRRRWTTMDEWMDEWMDGVAGAAFANAKHARR
jgi:hypothetical protein